MDDNEVEEEVEVEVISESDNTKFNGDRIYAVDITCYQPTSSRLTVQANTADEAKELVEKMLVHSKDVEIVAVNYVALAPKEEPANLITIN